jgi:HlyD family secretion protein
VERIGWQVLKQRVYAQEPNASSDNRVVEVKIEIDQSENRQVQNLTNLQVEIAIPLEKG